jgi:PAS domain S-box-containing protein
MPVRDNLVLYEPMVAPKPFNESERLQALYRYEILDTPNEQAFDDLVRLAAQICQTPVSVVNFIDADRQWFKAEVGLGVRETPLGTSLCAHAILQRGLVIIPDTLRDTRFQDNPLCYSDPPLRFYAGALLETAEGLPLGTLCVLDYTPRDLTPPQKEALSTLSRQVMTLLDLRISMRSLKESEAFARTVLDNSPDCVKVLDLMNRIVHINDEGCRVMEVDNFNLVRNANWLDFWQGSVRESAEAAVEAAWLGRKTEFSGPCATLKGTPKYWEVAVAPILDQSGTPVKLIVSSRDITKRRETEEQLRQTSKLQSLAVLAGGIAHDFNNLLTGILGFASLLSEAVAPADRYMADSIVSEAQRAAHLTKQMLAYSGQSQFEMKPVDLSREVREALRVLDLGLTRNILFSLELDDHLPMIQGDSHHIRELLFSLISNASEALGGKKGTITVRTSTVLDRGPSSFPHVLLEVCDDGCGMDAATKERIFDPFFTTKFTGRGLGLAAVSGIARGHNGVVRVESQIGKGTVFQVFFPAVADADTGSAVFTRKKEVEPVVAILIVDDEEMVRKLAKTALERAGFEVRIAEDGKKAVDAFSAAPDTFALVLLDVTMPVMSGEEAFRLIRQIRPDVPVIVSSGYDEAEVKRRFERGVSGFLQKPYSASKLVEKVKTLVAKRVPAAASLSNA